MKALRSFTVRARLPEELAPLEELAVNLRWSWDAQTRDLFRWVDPDAWDATVRDPVRLLGLVGRTGSTPWPPTPRSSLPRRGPRRAAPLPRRAPLVPDPAASAGPLRRVAYFSPEFGIAEALPQYSGGLGVLAGDHLKAASDLGVPLVGVGLLYRHGYFRQALNADGWQQERYPDLDPHAMALTACDGVRVTVELGGRPLVAQVWRRRRRPGAAVPARHRRRREPRPSCAPSPTGCTAATPSTGCARRSCSASAACAPSTRSASRPRCSTPTRATPASSASSASAARSADGLAFPEALEAVRAGNVFTTHTPVPAGIDRFPCELIERYFGGWAKECGVALDELMALGHRPGDEPDDRFNMAVMGLRLAERSNGVSGVARRGQPRDVRRPVARRPADEVPIGSVTNGVHAATWVSAEMSDLLSRHIRPDWSEAPADEWERLADVGDDELWRVREQGRERLVGFVRERLKRSAMRQGRVGVRRRLDRRGARPAGAHDRLRPAVRHLQAGHPAAVAARPAARAAAVARPADPVRVRRQGPPGRRPGQGDHPPDRGVRLRPRGAAPLRVPRRLRHRRRPHAVPGRRRVAEHPPPAPGGVRHVAA